MHLNISSLQTHIDDLHEFLVCLSYRPDVLCISKTRIIDVPPLTFLFLNINFFMLTLQQ